ncbi:MAG: hypothetical protein AAFR59_15160, partial [Bacteroidota bacterium]
MLFGDEPTGNLDEWNGHNLFRLIREQVSTSGLSAIIASHDINLALTHADQIIVLGKDDPNAPSGIIQQHDSSHWADDEARKAYREELVKHYQIVEAESPPHQTSLQQGYATHKALFLKKEGNALRGKRNSNWWILTTIIALTLLAIGFGNGGLRYLNQTMNNAFVNWLDINIPISTNSKVNIEALNKELNDSQWKELFDYRQVSSYVEYNLRFFKKDRGLDDYNWVAGRTLDLSKGNNPLVNEILGPNNRLKGDNRFYGDDDLSIIVTKELLTSFGYPLETAFIPMPIWIFTPNDSANGYDLKVPIPIRAVVKDIPGNSDFATTLGFFKTYTQKNLGSFNTQKHQQLRIFFPIDSLEVASTLQKLKQLDEKDEWYTSLDPDYSHMGSHRYSYLDGQDIEVTFFPNIQGAKMDSAWQVLQKLIQDELG